MQLILHDEPVGQVDSDHIAHVSLGPFGFADLAEQLWLKKLGPTRYKVCCIPFRVYGVALGDIVRSSVDGTVVVEVEKPSEHRVLRAFVPVGISDANLVRSSLRIKAAIKDLDVLSEWSGDRHVAVDVPPGVDVEKLVHVIQREEVAGYVLWEWADAQQFVALASAACDACGTEVSAHDRHERFTLPEPVLSLKDKEQTPETWMSHGTAHESVMMQVPGAGAFVRVLLPVRLSGGHSITYGAWLAIDPRNLQNIFSAWWSPDYADLEVEGLLANRISPWGLLGSPVKAVVRNPDETPYCESSSNPELNQVLHEEWPCDVVFRSEKNESR